MWFDFDGAGGDLSIAESTGGIVLRDVLSRTVNRDARIVTKVFDAPRARHHPEIDLAVVIEVDLGAADARRSVSPDSCHSGVLANRESPPNRVGKFGCAGRDVGP